MDLRDLLRRILALVRRGHVCPGCRGTGGSSDRPCPDCGGRGRL